MGDTMYVTLVSGTSFKRALMLCQNGHSCERRYIDVLAGENRLPSIVVINPHGQVPYVADLAVDGYTHLADEGGIGLNHFPNLQAWMARLRRPLDNAEIGALLSS
ncbi:MAG: hypothetical protein JNN30_12485 [Rhodanobacteraceae bacterium]|nr:hypothetical protein [Rhodanobacteraceae bacterium]